MGRLMGVRLSNLQDKESESSKPRQRNLLTLFKNQPSTRKREEETNFSCPICDENCENLNDLNNHIDGCLPDNEDNKETSDDDKKASDNVEINVDTNHDLGTLAFGPET